MSRRCWVFFAVTFELLYGSKAQTCDKAVQGPIVLPISNLTVEGARLRRGTQFQYGTPPQTLAVAVSQGYNETYVYDQSGQCGGTSTSGCAAERGGAFDESSSSTWTSFDIAKLNSADNVTASVSNNGLAGSDTLTINSTLSYDAVSVAVPRMDGPDFSVLGLGKDSRMLNYARNAGDIASSSYSVFWGQTGLTEEHAHDGAVVLGGLDETQTTGANFTGDISYTGTCRSGMVIGISDMTVVLPDGSGGSLMGGSAKGQVVNYCLETEFPMITMLDDQWDYWQYYEPNLDNDGTSPYRAGGNPNIWGMVYPAVNQSKADLKIIIGGSLEITVPNHQLVQAYYTFGSDGGMVVNNTVQELMINPLQAGNAHDLPKFGMTFFQAAYLHVNYDTGKFTLWQAANPSGPGKFVGIGGSTIGCPNDTSTTNTTPSNTNSTGNGNANQDPHDSDSSLSGGAIAGIVAGAIAIILAVAGLAFVLYRRKKSRRTSGPPSETATPLYSVQPEKQGVSGAGIPAYYSGNFKPELDSTTTASQRPYYMGAEAYEVPAVGVHRPVMEPQEMPHERY